MIYHGGGVTPMTQTCDTDLNQHVRKEYATKEAAELIELMRHGASVPSMGPLYSAPQWRCKKFDMQYRCETIINDKAGVGLQIALGSQRSPN